MKVDVAEGRKIEHPLGNDASVANDNDRIRMKGRKLRPEFLIHLDAIRLGDWNPESRRRLFYRRANEFETASFGTIRLGNHKVSAEAGRGQLFERRNSESRRAAENEIQRHCVIGRSGDYSIAECLVRGLEVLAVALPQFLPFSRLDQLSNFALH